VSRSIKLITGIPRSGTTLCCKLLNQRADVVALHEPINPGAMPQSYTAKEALDSIVVQIGQFDRAIEHIKEDLQLIILLA
jgi:broad-specificity NMP kinase